jgi:membrane protease YdiL (CAAX protease family)
VAADPVNDALRMAGCGLAVAAVALPVGLVGYLVSQKRGEQLCPRWRPWRVPWGGFEVLCAYVFLFEVIRPLTLLALAQAGFFQQVYGERFPPLATSPPPRLEEAAAAAGAPAAVASQDLRVVADGIRGLWAYLAAFPIQAAVIIAGYRALYGRGRQPRAEGGIASRVVLVVVGWVVIAPVTLLVHAAVLSAFAGLGWSPDDHPLARFGLLLRHRPVGDQMLYAVVPCVVVPVIEEMLFRVVLLGWLVGRGPVSPWRVWGVLAVGVVWAAKEVLGGGAGAAGVTRGPVLFAAGLLLGWVVLSAVLRHKRRTVGAVYASAALFAVVHSGVWPSPVPLFVLGLGLGYLAVRTRGFLVPAAVHGLFNAVSVLFVLSSTA